MAMPELEDLRKKLETERDVILKKSAPLQAAKEKLQEQIKPLELKLAELDDQIAAIERPRMAEINQQLAGIARTLGAKGIKAETGTVGTK